MVRGRPRARGLQAERPEMDGAAELDRGVPPATAGEARQRPRLARSASAGAWAQPDAAAGHLGLEELLMRAEQREAIADLRQMRVLIDAVLDDGAAVPDLAEVAVDALHQSVAAVAHLALHGVERDRRAVVERLEARGAAGVAEHLRPDVARLPAYEGGDRVERLSDVGDQLLAIPAERGEEQPTRRSVGAEDVLPADLLELRPEGDDAVPRARLEAPPLVRPEGHSTAVERDVVDLEAVDLRLSAAGEQERRDQSVEPARRDRQVRALRTVVARGL